MTPSPRGHTVSPPPHPSTEGGQLSVLNFEKEGSEKNLPGGLTMFLVKKRLLKIKYSFEDSKILAYHLNNMTRNYNVFVGCFEIRISAIVKHVQHFGIIRAFVSLGLINFFRAWKTEKSAGLWFVRGGSVPRLTLWVVSKHL